MEKIKACPICDNTSLEIFLTTQDHFLTKEEFSIDKCTSCGFLFTNPRPLEENSQAYYQSEEYISHSDSNKGIMNKIYQLVRTFAIKQKVKLVKKYIDSGNALDLGCGTGHFLNELSNNGFSVQGVEPGLEARSAAQEQFGLEVSPSLSDIKQKPGHYQIITLWHVLEHIYDLKEYLNKIEQLLDKNGILIIAVPNPESDDATFYKEHWAAYDLPRHLYHFSRSTIQLLLKNYNYNLVEMIPMKFDSYYVSMLSEKYKRGKNNHLHAFYHGLSSNLKASSKNSNYSSVIYIFKPKIG